MLIHGNANNVDTVLSGSKHGLNCLQRPVCPNFWDHFSITVKFLNFRTPEIFAVINLKFQQRGKTFKGYFVIKMQME